MQPAELLNILSTAADAADRLERDFSEWKRTLSLEGLTIISATTTITRETPYGNYGDTETVLEDLTEETKNSIKNIADFIELDLVRRVESLFQRVSNYNLWSTGLLKQSLTELLALVDRPQIFCQWRRRNERGSKTRV